MKLRDIMKKEKKTQYIHYLCIIAFLLLIIFITTGKDAMFGSKMDWIGQHTSFPDYFRMLFYQTGDLFPNFAFNIGGGANIYYFSYYGFLNPIFMLSYLLPFVRMVDYIVVVNILTVLATGILLYRFLLHKKFSLNISLMTTLISVASTFLIFHAHRHYMFMNYMPFLILGLFGVDRYFKSKKKGLFIISVFLMIMTSYYYSIPGILVLALYAISEIIKKNDSYRFSTILKEGYPLLLSTFLAVAMAGILLLPTAYVILAGRGGGGGVKPSLLSLLIPKANIRGLVYDPYTLGVTAISVFAIFASLISKKKNQRFLSLMTLLIVCVPIFVYLLNGALYVREKVLLPFFPIIAYFLATCFSDIEKKQINMQTVSVITVIFSCFALLTGSSHPIFYIDLLITFIALYYTNKKQNMMILFAVTFTIAAGACLITQSQDTMPTKSFYNDQIASNTKQELIKEILDKEDEFVRMNQRNDPLYTVNRVYNPRFNRTSQYSSTFNKEYADFLRKDLKIAYASRNPLIMKEVEDTFLEYYLGVKYIITTETEGPGYQKIKTVHDKKTNKEYHLYENKNVLPVFYAREKTISTETYQKLKYPENVLSLLQYVIVDKSNQIPELPKVETLEGLKISHEKNVSIKQENNEVIIQSKKDGYFRLELPEGIDKDLLLFEADMVRQASCEEGDLSIRIEQVENKLTCKEWYYQNNNHQFHYVISNHKHKNYLNVWLKKGTYHLKNVKAYHMSQDVLNQITEDVIPFDLNKEKSMGDHLEGTIKTSKDSYFVTSIPYDEGFTIKVDGKEIKYEKVNRAFIGFPLEKGTHQITFDYVSPFKRAGIVSSISGFIIFFIILVVDKRRK